MKQIKPTKPTQEQRLFCQVTGMSFEQFTGMKYIDHNVWFDFIPHIPKGFSPNIGGHLSLRQVKSISEGFSPTVGGDLCLNSITELPKGFNPTVGGYLNLSSIKVIPKLFKPNVVEFVAIAGKKFER